MRIGVTFPQNEITADSGAVRAYAETAESLGYTHLLAYDHVLGADTTHRPDWRPGAYTKDSLFHEPFVLFGYLAGLTQRIEFVTGVIILPQRQTALVAKQAAEIAVLSGGRFRLGVGVGWNPVEYQSLNENFANRGKRSEEQIAVLRALFAEPVVTFRGAWHTIEAAGLNPLPAQPIPIWIGGSVDTTLQRVARLGDGWFPQMGPDDSAREAVATLRQYTEAAGRDPNAIGIEARVSIGGKTPDDWAREVEGWRQIGATHLAVNTMKAGLQKPQEHIDAIRRFWEAVT